MIHEDKGRSVFYCDECGRPMYESEAVVAWDEAEGMFWKRCPSCFGKGLEEQPWGPHGA